MKNSITFLKQEFNSFVLLIFVIFTFVNSGNLMAQEIVLSSYSEDSVVQIDVTNPAEIKKFLENPVVITDLGNGYPPIWDQPVPQPTPHGIIASLESNPRINNIPLEKFDYIGGFYTDDNGELRCGGAIYWPDTIGMLFPIYRDNPNTPEKDGFYNQELIYLKLFSFSTMKDYLVDVVAFDPEFPGTDKFGSLVISRLTNMQALEDFDFFIEPSENPLCIGDELVLSGQEFIGTGGNYSFLWSSDDPDLGFDYTIQFPPPVFPTQNTTFTLVVQDGTYISEHSLTVQVEDDPIALAGPDGEFCANDVYGLSGEAQNFSSVEWTTNGDGEIADPYSLETTYAPGPADITAGQVTITLDVMPKTPCDFISSDQLQLDILPLPDVNAGEDIIGCTNDDIEVSAVASDYSLVEWTTSGDGYFENPNDLSSLYIADGNDFQNGVSLYICAEASAPCLASVCDTVNVEYVPSPTVLGPSSKTGCENSFFSISGIAYNYSSTEWTTQGDGTFENPFIFATKYYPGVQDIENQGTIITLNAYPFGDCDIATKNVTINIVNLPEISFGPNSGNICMGDEFLQLNATVEHTNSVSWSTNGDGTFDNNTISNPKYYPGTEDEQNGQFELELLAYPLPYCSSNIIENLTVIYQDNPEADAGEDAVICEGEIYEISDADASSYSGLNWSGGNGTFSNSSALNPEYTPSPDEFGTTVTLCLNAAPISPCDVAASDCMDLTIEKSPDADAGSDAVICEGETWQLDGTVLYTNNFTWSTSGDGEFSNETIEDPVYTPGPADIQSGAVTLTLTAQPNAPCTAVAQDAMQLDIQLEVIATTGDDATICDIDDHPLSSANAEYYETLTWSTSGDGNFSNVSAENPTYFPGTDDIETGNVVLTLDVAAIAPCAGNITDTKTLTIIRSVDTDAGVDASICEGETWQLDGTVLYTNNFTWSTSGDGEFSNETIEDPDYTPGPADIQSGAVTLTLTAQPNAPCTAVAQDAMQLDIQLEVTATAGDDATICDIDNHQLSSAGADYYETLTWSTSGDGNFSNVSAENPTYFPGTDDIETGNVVLTLNVAAIAPCAGDITDTKILTIIRSVDTDAGVDASICEGETWQLDGTVLYTNNFTWSTSGDGEFSDEQIENPVYTPGAADIANGSVILTLTAQPNAPCTAVAFDFITLEIAPLASLNIGGDIEVCGIESIVLDDVSADNFSDLVWTTSGDGTFSDPQIMNPEYFPGMDDLNSNQVILTLTLNPIAPCTGNLAADKLLLVALPPTAQAGDDITICDDQIELSGGAENYNSIIWTTNGDGAFNNPSLLNATYFPGEGDFSTGQVQLTLTATANEPCSSPATDALNINFEELELENDFVVDKDVQLGNLLFFSFSVSSQVSGEYAWYFNGEVLPDQVNPFLIIYNMQPENAGNYQGTFTNPCGTVETNTAFVQVFEDFSQDIEIPEGWSGLSSFVTPDNPALESVFSDIVNDLVIMSNDLGVYWPGQNINTLGDLAVVQGYQIKLNNNATLSVDGKIRYPLNELTIQPGWSFLPVNTNCAISTLDQFADLDGITMIKEIAGSRIYWPELGINTLNELIPGKAYLILNSSDNPVTFKYNECSKSYSGMNINPLVPQMQTPWNDLSATTTTHVIGLSAKAMEELKPGDIVGVFNVSGVCSGLEVVNQNENASLIAFGDEMLTETTEGLVDGEEMNFRVYRPSTGETFDANATFDNKSSQQNVFTKNGVSVIQKLTLKSATGVNDYEIAGDNIRIYPNPTSGVLNVSIENTSNEKFIIDLMNASGQVLISKQSTGKKDFSIQIGDQPKGVYYLKIVAGKTVKVEKVILK